MLILEDQNWQIYRFPVSTMAANCYFLVDISSKNTIIIDPGAEGDFLSDQVFSLGLTPTLIFLTHGHADHVGGVLPLFLNFSVPIYLDRKDFFLYSRAQATSQHFTHLPADPVVPPDVILSHSALLQLLATFPSSLTPLPYPGHTPGLTALYAESSGFLFSGDLIFADGSLGRTDFSYSRTRDMNTSLAQLHQLPASTHIFPGHGEDFLLAFSA